MGYGRLEKGLENTSEETRDTPPFTRATMSPRAAWLALLLLRGAAGVRVPFSTCAGVGPDQLGVSSLVISPARLDGGVTSIFASATTTAELTFTPSVEVGDGATVEYKVQIGGM